MNSPHQPPKTSDTLHLKLHPKQGDAFLSEKKITLCASGIQGGKTSVGALWMLRQFSKWKGNDHSFIIATPNYKILNQSTLPTFMKYCGQFGVMKKADAEFRLHSGAPVYFRTSTNPWSVEGIQNVRAIWCDEAGLCSFTFWINLEGRAARTNAPIMCTTTPYGMNWPYQQLIKPTKEGERSDVAYYQWLSIENPSFPKEEYERQKQILDPRTFRRKYMGQHERLEGLVYDLTNDHRVRSFPLPKGTRFFAGVDWGFSEGHEFGLVVRASTLDGFRYEVDEFKGSGLDPNQQIEICKQMKALWGVELFGCDPARPDMIALLNKSGCKAIGFHVGQESYKSVISGIQAHTALMRSGKYRIFEDKCPHLIDEYEAYHWPEFQEDAPAKKAPVKMNDHVLDCARMVTVLTQNVFIREPDQMFMHAKAPWVDRFDPRKPSKKVRSWESY
jgi:phage terminase large subunit